MEQKKRVICVYLCSSVEKICPDLFCTDLIIPESDDVWDEQRRPRNVQTRSALLVLL
jgi:hypothetical protein